MRSNIEVKKDDLLATLKKNREEHRAIFEAALEAYRAKAIEEFEKRLADVKAGRKIDRFISIPEPEDFTESFDTAIAMLEWQIGGTVELSEKEFSQYVLNKWDWDQRFTSNTASYVAQ